MKLYKMNISIVVISVFGILILSLCALGIFQISAWKETIINLSPTYHELFTQQQLKEKGHQNIIPEYSTDVSIGYENEDGTKSLYVYASPIRYLNSSGQLSLIDTRIANVRDEDMRSKEYIYTIANSDIKPFFPKQITKQKGILISKDCSYEIGLYNDEPALGWYETQKNFIEEEKATVVYKKAMAGNLDIGFYPSSLGTNCKIELDDSLKDGILSFWLRVEERGIIVKKEPGGYLTLNKSTLDETGKAVNEVLGVIQKPLLKDTQGNISQNNSIELFQRGKDSIVCNSTLIKNF